MGNEFEMLREALVVTRRDLELAENVIDALVEGLPLHWFLEQENECSFVLTPATG